MGARAVVIAAFSIVIVGGLAGCNSASGARGDSGTGGITAKVDGAGGASSSSAGGDAGSVSPGEAGGTIIRPPPMGGSGAGGAGSGSGGTTTGGSPTDASSSYSGGQAGGDGVGGVGGTTVPPSTDGGSPRPNACSWRDTAAVTIATPFSPPDDSLTFTPPTIPCTLFDITGFGAKADGTTMNTSAFAQAVAAASAAGGGVVYVPAGVFLSGAIHLASRIELHLEKGATIKFSAATADYLPAVLTRWEGLDVMNYSPLVYAVNATDVAITGAGILEGPGTAWGGGTLAWKTAAAAVDSAVYQIYFAALPKGVGTVPAPPNAIQANGGPALRPTFVECYGCRNLLIEGATVTGAPYWTLHPVYSSNVIIRNMIIDSTGPGTGSNGDGTDPDSCSNCLIDGVTYSTSDDNIAIKSGLNEDGIAVGMPSRNIVIRNVKSTTGHGGITIGSEMSGGVSNVFATGNHFLGVEDPIRIKTLNGRGGVIENLWFEDSTLGWTKDGVIVTTQYPSSTIPPHDPTLVPILRNLHMIGLTGTGTGPVCNFTGPASAIELRNLNLMGSAGTCTKITGITLSNVIFNGALVTMLPGC